VLEVARRNPWSAALFGNPRIEQRIGDAVDVVAGLPAAAFDRVLHDPPVIALGGDLYGAAFYRELFRVLRRGGRLFHYIGNPDTPSGARTTRGVVRRLGEVGFNGIRARPDAFGVVAVRGGR
jgi:predicted methyltransferase